MTDQETTIATAKFGVYQLNGQPYITGTPQLEYPVMAGYKYKTRYTRAGTFLLHMLHIMGNNKEQANLSHELVPQYLRFFN